MPGTWHGRFTLELDETAFWQAGPLQIWARRRTHEWRLALLRGSDSMEHGSVAEVPTRRTEAPEEAPIRRLGFRAAPAQVELIPALADRPIVVTPEEQLDIAPREELQLFISTPAWVQMHFGEHASALVDEPTARPSDTWFGASTMKGELCYASRTAARLQLDNVPRRLHRVISIVEIRNHGKQMLRVEKIKIPVMHQSVYAAEDGSLWTENLSLTANDHGEMAALRLASGAPAEASAARLLQGPRIPVEGGLLTRAFGGLLR